MRFDVSNVRDYLNENDMVYTVRSYYVPRKMDVIVPGVGLCERELVKGFFSTDLIEEFVPCSGFSSLSDWVSAIRKFIPEGRMLYLYLVKRIPETKPEREKLFPGIRSNESWIKY